MNLHEQPALPISFSPDMVEAILAGRKNQTRRLVKSTALEWLTDVGFKPEFVADPLNGVCPYKEAGALLWVREEHRIWTEQKPQDQCLTFHCEYKDGTVISKYAKELPLDTAQRLMLRKTIGKWQRARFLPRYFARTYLKITDILVERLQGISEEDAIAEGIQPLLASRAQLAQHGQLYMDYSKPAELFNDGLGAIESYHTLWEKITGPGSWEASPWVWVVKFKKVEDEKM